MKVCTTLNATPLCTKCMANECRKVFGVITGRLNVTLSRFARVTAARNQVRGVSSLMVSPCSFTHSGAYFLGRNVARYSCTRRT
uniref:Uncharacterized protein n=1 Tax=Yersinia enterocolitica TaxID=630 RepID=B0RKN4_YEREN|nr:hypothetical protein [Yersinia enterocolitica]